MHVQLPPELEEFVRDRVASGRNDSETEVVISAISAPRERDAQAEADLETLRREIAIGLKDLDEGRKGPLDIEAIKRDGRRRLAEQRTKA